MSMPLLEFKAYTKKEPGENNCIFFLRKGGFFYAF